MNIHPMKESFYLQMISDTPPSNEKRATKETLNAIQIIINLKVKLQEALV